MTQGRVIAVVGPSGVGKDSVIEALALQMPNANAARRVITRPRDAGGEDFDSVSEARFQTLTRDGAFALWWRAHGLSYGIPAQIDDNLGRGQDVLANLSRSVLGQAARRFDALIVIHLTARPEVLAKRLAGRGRETEDEIAQRLARTVPVSASGVPAITIDNSGALEDTVSTCIRALSTPAQCDGARA